MGDSYHGYAAVTKQVFFRHGLKVDFKIVQLFLKMNCLFPWVQMFSIVYKKKKKVLMFFCVFLFCFFCLPDVIRCIILNFHLWQFDEPT